MKIRSPYWAFLLWLVAAAYSSPPVNAASNPQHLIAESTTWPVRLHVHSDFDGDHVPDTAIVRRHGEHYSLSIHFAGKASKTFSAYYTGEPVIGITSMDVDGDRDRDIVLLGLNSVLPAGLWINDSPQAFRIEVPWLAVIVYPDSLARLNRSFLESPDPDPGSLTDPGPDASVTEGLFLSLFSSETTLGSFSNSIPLQGLSVRVPARSPPLIS